MFNAEYFLARLREQPFVPFRLITSSGQAYDVAHPDLVLVGKGRLIVGTASNDNPRFFETTSNVSMLHITDLQDLTLTAKPGSNGTV